MSKVRASEDIKALIAKLMASADALQNNEAPLSDEQMTELTAAVTEIEELQGELTQAVASERMVAAKARMSEPVLPAPKVPAQVRDRSREEMDFGKAFGAWMNGERTGDGAYRARTAGFDTGESTIRVPVNYGTLNRKLRAQMVRERTIMSKGGTASGLELTWRGYSDKVVDYLTFFSPILGLLSSETTGDGNRRTYFKVDDTAMISTFTSDSGGSETVPTIPDTNLATGSVDIDVFDITSGYQKISFNELRDSYISLEDKIAKANSNSHARKLEKQIVKEGTGNGTTGVQSLWSAATALSDVAAWSKNRLQNALQSVPIQYRQNVVFLSNDYTRNQIDEAMVSTVGDSLWGRTVEEGFEFDTFLGKKYLVSEYMSNNDLLIFNPDLYQLRLVAGQTFQKFVEKFFPNLAWAGLMSFGGAWLGPTTAIKRISVSGNGSGSGY